MIEYDAETDWHQYLLGATRIARYGTITEIEFYIQRLSGFPFHLLNSKDSKKIIFEELVRLLKMKRNELKEIDKPNLSDTWTGNNIVLQHPKGTKIRMKVDGFQGQVYQGKEQWVLMGTISKMPEEPIKEKGPEIYDSDPKRELMI